jgi:hypothetical protein
MLVYSFLVAASLMAVSNGHCGDSLINGVDPSDTNTAFQGLFTYPEPGDDVKNLFDVNDNVDNKRRFDNDGVLDFNQDPDNTTLYQAQDDEGDKFGNTLNIDDVYGGDAETFKDLCEELWACAYVHLREYCCYMDDRLYFDF